MFTVATTPPRILTLVLLTVVSLVSLNLILPSLAHMAADFQISYATASLSISLFMAITAGLQLIVGPMSDLYGRRPVLLVSMALFAAGSVGCVLAEGFWGFMAFRTLQSAVIAANVVSRAIVRDTSSPKDATAILGTIGMAMALGPMLAPTLGGLLDQLFGWRANFWLMMLAGLGMVWLTWADVGETNTAPNRNIRSQFRGYGQLLGDGLFWSYTMCMTLSVAIFFGFLTGTPLIAVKHFGLSGTLLGLSLGAPPVGFVLGNWLSTRLASRCEPATLLISGRVVTVLAMAVAVLVWVSGAHSAINYLIFMPFIGLGNGLTNPSGFAGAMSVRDGLAGSAAGLSGATMVAGGAAMTAITGAVLSRHGDPLTLLWLLFATAVLSLLAGLPALRAKSSPSPA